MYARELMIGDWARIRYNHFETGEEIVKDFRVGQLAKLGLGDDEPLYVWSEKSNMDKVSKVEPIPLTPEILEKNGFVQNPRSKSRRSHQICNSDVYISWWRGRLNILFKPFIGHSTNHVNVDGKYVHELQHALRICGIEKEIVL